MTRVRSVVALLAWSVTLAAVITGLHALGHGPLAAPDGWSRFGAWVVERDPLVAVVALVRLLALGAAWYLAATTALAVVAEVVRVGALLRTADLLTVGPVRRLSRAACGATLAVAATLGPTVAAAAAPALPGVAPPVTTSAPAATPRASVPALPGTAPPTVADTEVSDPTAAEVDGDAARRAVPADSADRADPADPSDAAETAGPADPVDGDAPADHGDDAAAAHEVRSGDSFWSIAAAELEDELGRPPSDDEVVPRWQAWIDANADRLAVPGDPDLLFPGQRLAVPDRAEGRA